MILDEYTTDLLTFPGIIIREFLHHYLADSNNLKVFEVCYFNKNKKPMGYVIHEEPTSLNIALQICIIPFMICSILCIFLTYSAYFPFVYLADFNCNAIFLLLLWIGLSAGVQAFPSKENVCDLSLAIRNSNYSSSQLSIAKVFCGFFDARLKFRKPMLFSLVFGLMLIQLLPMISIYLMN